LVEYDQITHFTEQLLRAPKQIGNPAAHFQHAAKKRLFSSLLMSTAGRSGGKGIDPRRMRGIRYGFTSFSMLQADSSRGGEERRNANQIISGRDEDEKPFNQVTAAIPGFAQSSNGLHPPERFFDPLAGGQTDAIGRDDGWKSGLAHFPRFAP